MMLSWRPWVADLAGSMDDRTLAPRTPARAAVIPPSLEKGRGEGGAFLSRDPGARHDTTWHPSGMKARGHLR